MADFFPRQEDCGEEWGVFPVENNHQLHVVPLAEAHTHIQSASCLCEPHITPGRRGKQDTITHYLWEDGPP